MQNFIEKWNSDPKFKTKTKLSLYTLFVIFVAVFAVSSRDNLTENELQDTIQEQYNHDDNQDKEKNINDVIEIPIEYNYKIDITINDNYYQYTGTKDSSKETITKEVDGVITNYIYENDSYYQEEGDSYILTTKEDVYDVVNYNYLKLETVNEYLSKGIQNENTYLVYLKDIILGNDSEDYIAITKIANQISIDYTELMKNFDKTINNYLVKIEIEEIE